MKCIHVLHHVFIIFNQCSGGVELYEYSILQVRMRTTVCIYICTCTYKCYSSSLAIVPMWNESVKNNHVTRNDTCNVDVMNGIWSCVMHELVRAWNWKTNIIICYYHGYYSGCYSVSKDLLQNIVVHTLDQVFVGLNVYK